VGLIDGRNLGIQSIDALHALEQTLAITIIVKASNHVHNVVALPVGILRIVATMENLLEDAEVVRDVEAVAAVLVAEEEVEVVVAAPRDGGQAQRARLMRGQEDAVLGLRPRRRRQLVQLLDRVDLAVPQRILHLVVALGDYKREVGFLQDRRAEQLVAPFHLAPRLRRYVALHHVQQTRNEPRRFHGIDPENAKTLHPDPTGDQMTA